MSFGWTLYRTTTPHQPTTLQDNHSPPASHSTRQPLPTSQPLYKTTTSHQPAMISDNQSTAKMLSRCTHTSTSFHFIKTNIMPVLFSVTILCYQMLLVPHTSLSGCHRTLFTSWVCELITEAHSKSSLTSSTEMEKACIPLTPHN